MIKRCVLLDMGVWLFQITISSGLQIDSVKRSQQVSVSGWKLGI
ncbi:MAG: hypothetical protein ACI9ES_001916 [Oceanospirillaceae bacterium]|jgi:hypothetical protein